MKVKYLRVDRKNAPLVGGHDRGIEETAIRVGDNMNKISRRKREKGQPQEDEAAYERDALLRAVPFRELVYEGCDRSTYKINQQKREKFG